MKKGGESGRAHETMEWGKNETEREKDELMINFTF